MQQQGIFSKQPIAKFEIANSQITISHQGCPRSKRRRRDNKLAPSVAEARLRAEE
jgi:hypothetical protein